MTEKLLRTHQEIADDIQNRPWVAKGDLTKLIPSFGGLHTLDIRFFESPATLLDFILESNSPEFIQLASDELQQQALFYTPILSKMGVHTTFDKFSVKLRSNSDFALLCLSENDLGFSFDPSDSAKLFKKLHSSLTEDLNFVHKALAVNLWIYPFLSLEQRQEPGCFQTLVSRESHFLSHFFEHIPHHLITKQHCLHAYKIKTIQCDHDLFKGLPVRHRTDKDILIAALTKEDNLSYRDLLYGLKEDRDVQIAAMKNESFHNKSLPSDWYDDKELMLLNLAHTPETYLYCSTRLLGDRDIMAQTVDSMIYQWFSPSESESSGILHKMLPFLSVFLDSIGMEALSLYPELPSLETFQTTLEKAKNKEIHHLLKQDQKQHAELEKTKPIKSKLGRI